MKTHKTYKVELKPNNAQVTHLKKACGISRLSYNWGLAYIKDLRDRGEKYIGKYSLRNALVSVKKSEFPFMYEVSKNVPEHSIFHLDKAMQNFFRGCKQGKNIGFPKFKKRGRCRDSFCLDACVKISKESVKIPVLKSTIRFKERSYIPYEDSTRYINATISKDVDRWYLCVTLAIEVEEKEIEEVLGIDLGISKLVTCSNGDTYDNHKFTKKYEKKLKKSQQSVSRKKKGSSNREKSKLVVQKVFRKIRRCRSDIIHKMTSSITKTKCRLIVIEDLNVKGMVKNKKLSKALHDASFGSISNQLHYKSIYYGGKIAKIDRWFPSSKTCSSCGDVKDSLPLSERIFRCNECGLVMDRDLNASVNIQNYFNPKNTVGHTEFKACGENVRLESDVLDNSSLNEARSELIDV